MRLVVMTCLMLFATAASASVDPLTFPAWKDQQILEAQNNLLRTSARIAQIKSGKSAVAGSKEAVAALPSSKVKKAGEPTDLIAAAERDLKRAQESLETANGLQFGDYVEVYLPTLENNPEALQKLTEKLSKEELAEILKGLMRKDSRSDAKRSNSMLEALSGASVPKTL